MDIIHDVALEMVTEDGVIWIHGIGDDAALAITEFGIETLLRSLKSTKTWSRAPAPDASAYPARGPRRILTRKAPLDGERGHWSSSSDTSGSCATAGSRSMRVSANRWGISSLVA